MSGTAFLGALSSWTFPGPISCFGDARTVINLASPSADFDSIHVALIRNVVTTSITGGHSKRGLRKTRKPTYSPVLTTNI